MIGSEEIVYRDSTGVGARLIPSGERRRDTRGGSLTLTPYMLYVKCVSVCRPRPARTESERERHGEREERDNIMYSASSCAAGSTPHSSVNLPQNRHPWAHGVRGKDRLGSLATTYVLPLGPWRSREATLKRARKNYKKPPPHHPRP